MYIYVYKDSVEIEGHGTTIACAMVTATVISFLRSCIDVLDYAVDYELGKGHFRYELPDDAPEPVYLLYACMINTLRHLAEDYDKEIFLS